MKQFFFSVCIVFLLSEITAQNVNYIPYYHLVNRAKIAHCVHANCDSAIVYYLQAFNSVDYILLDNLRDFTRCAILTGQDSLVYYAMDKCVEQTVYLSFVFLSDSLFDKYKYTEKWNKCYAIEKENIEKYEAKYFNSPHKKILNSLLPSDQKIRKKWLVYAFPNLKKSKELAREGVIIDSCNQLVLDEMIQKYDYPNERNGLPNNILLMRGGGAAVLIHYRDTDFLRNVEHKALIEGKLSPAYYALKAQQVAKLYKLPLLKYTYSYKKGMTAEERAQVNKNRYAIGLPSVEEGEMIKQCNRIAAQQRNMLQSKQKKTQKK